ncbi:MAG: hypothetical protein JO311_07245 [Candidatus Eremiobacteraeota bacterium]|nr:hypothetical protein [Candidatus Eremiobacteraeota bacterium]MBV9263028.1 hypothetical protein [Candidatus Eremiobacteraeota bacterium]
MRLWTYSVFIMFVALGLVLGTRAAAQQGQCNGWTATADIDGNANVNQTVCGDIHVQGKIDGSSVVTLTSTTGSITIDGKIDNNSKVILNAARDIRIGVVGGDGDKKIDGGSWVSAFSGGSISLGNKIDGCPDAAVFAWDPNHPRCSAVFFRASNGIDIGNKIDGGVYVALCTANGGIHIHDKIDNGRTRVYYWPGGSLQVDGGQHGGSQVNTNQQTACQGLPVAPFPQYPL